MWKASLVLALFVLASVGYAQEQQNDVESSIKEDLQGPLALIATLSLAKPSAGWKQLYGLDRAIGKAQRRIRDYKGHVMRALRTINFSAKKVLDVDAAKAANVTVVSILRASVGTMGAGVTRITKRSPKVVLAIRSLTVRMPNLVSNPVDWTRDTLKLEKWIAITRQVYLVDICKNNVCVNCKNGAKCARRSGAMVCLCPSAFTGKFCDRDAPRNCPKAPTLSHCFNGARCYKSKKAGYAKCACIKGFAGADCSVKTNGGSKGFNGNKFGNGKKRSAKSKTKRVRSKKTKKLVKKAKKVVKKIVKKLVKKLKVYKKVPWVVDLLKAKAKKLSKKLKSRRISGKGKTGYGKNGKGKGKNGKGKGKNGKGKKGKGKKGKGKKKIDVSKYFRKKVTKTKTFGKYVNPCKKVDRKGRRRCVNGAKCYLTADKEAYCKCKPGFKGRRCQINIDDCKDEPCQNGGKCVDKVNNYKCKCPFAFGGKNCQIIVDYCAVKRPCGNGSKCVNSISPQELKETRRRIASLVELPTSPVASNATKSSAKPASVLRKALAKTFKKKSLKALMRLAGSDRYKCLCKPGFSGNDCENDVDDCKNKPCANGGVCYDKENDFKCSCQPGWKGKRCNVNINDCKPNTCKNGGKCVDRVNNFKCQCKKGFNGRRCQNNINDCRRGTCANGGTCIDGVNSYRCNCPLGFTGKRCRINVDDCKDKPCQNGGKCVDGINSYKCECKTGFAGLKCDIDVDDCKGKPCRNGAACIDRIGGYECRCKRGWSGGNCEVNIDDCASSPCLNRATCVDGLNSFTCKCKPGFAGPTCKLDVNDCDPNPCQNGGKCSDLVNGFSCKCSKGFSGEKCENAKKCQKLVARDFASATTTNQNRFPSTATYKCARGYFTKMPKTRTCGPDGKWDGKRAKCRGVDCAVLPKAANAVFRVSNKGSYPSTATYKCLPGYKTFDSLKRICGTKGSWGGASPVCKGRKCRPLSRIANGIVHASNKGRFPSFATYKCAAGFNLIGKDTRKCGTNGIWSGEHPQCVPVKCKKLRFPKNAVVTTTNENKYPSTAAYNCAPGYTTTDSLSRHCNLDGSWTGRRPKCRGVPCAPLANTRLANVTVSNEGRFPSIATYKCKKGYYSDMDMSRICKKSGNWKGSKPKCMGVKCAPLMPADNSKVSISNDGRFPAVASYTCDPGYSLQVTPTQRRCKADGTWGGKAAVCLGIKGEKPPALANARVEIRTNVFPTTASYICDKGYTTSDNTVVVLKPDGTWGGSQPRCQPIQCAILPPVSNGEFETSNSNYFPSRASFKCNDGYVLSQTKGRRCKTDGSWSGTQPRCVGRKCDALGNPALAKIVLTNDGIFPSTATYTCKKGFTTKDKRNRICRPDGSFGGSEPRCTGRPCESLSVPTNGLIKFNNTEKIYPAKATYKCAQGFVLIGGDKVRECGRSGAWSGVAPSCRSAECAAPPAIRNGFIALNASFFPAKATYSCKDGYYLDPPEWAVRLCNYKGSWKGSAPKCRGNKIKGKPKVAFALTSINSQQFPAELKVQCLPGYTGGGYVKAQEDGTFNRRDINRCKPNECLDLTAPRFGFVDQNSTTYPAVARFRCRKGYVVAGPVKRRCSTDGRWYPAELARCIGVPVPRPADIAYGVVKTDSDRFPSTATYSCYKGYEMVGNATRRASSEGFYRGVAPKCFAQAPPLKSIRDGNATVSSPYWPSVGTYTCDSGCELVGASQRSLSQNGQWSGNQPECRCLSIRFRVDVDAQQAGQGYSWSSPAAQMYIGQAFVAGTWGRYTYNKVVRGQPKDVVAMQVNTYGVDRPSALVSLSFKGRTPVVSGGAWKCRPTYNDYWEWQSTDDSETWVSCMEKRPIREPGNSEWANFPAEAEGMTPSTSRSTWGSANQHFMRYVLGGHKSWSMVRSTGSYMNFDHVEWKGKKGRLWLKGQVRCKSDILIGLSAAPYTKSEKYFMIIGSGWSNTKTKLWRIKRGTLSAADIKDKTKLAAVLGGRHYGYSRSKPDQYRVVTRDEELPLAGPGGLCNGGEFSDFWVAVQGKTLMFGRGKELYNDVIVQYKNDEVATLKYFKFGKDGDNDMVTYRNLQWGSDV